MRIYTIDYLKLLCAFMVVTLHVFPAYLNVSQAICRCAVPCFFMISGYLLYSEKNMSNRMMRSLKKILWIMLWSTILFLPLKLYTISHGRGIDFLSIKVWLNFLFFNENPVGGHLWYINAYLYVLILVYIAKKLKVCHWCYFIIPFLLAIDLVLGTYSQILLGNTFGYLYTRNFLFVGLPYFLIGILVHRYQRILLQNEKMSFVYAGCALLFCITSVVEKNVVAKLSLVEICREHYLSSTFLAISLLLLFISIGITRTTHSNTISTLGEQDSLYIYIFHPILIFFLNAINKRLPQLWTDDIYPYISPIIVFVATIVLTEILRRSQILKFFHI